MKWFDSLARTVGGAFTWFADTSIFKLMRAAGSIIAAPIFAATLAAAMTAWCIAWMGKTFDTVVIEKYGLSKFVSDADWAARLDDISNFMWNVTLKGGLLYPAVLAGEIMGSKSEQFLAASGRGSSTFEEPTSIREAMKASWEAVTDPRNKTALAGTIKDEGLRTKNSRAALQQVKDDIGYKSKFAQGIYHPKTELEAKHAEYMKALSDSVKDSKDLSLSPTEIKQIEGKYKEKTIDEQPSKKVKSDISDMAINNVLGKPSSDIEDATAELISPITRNRQAG